MGWRSVRKGMTGLAALVLLAAAAPAGAEAGAALPVLLDEATRSALEEDPGAPVLGNPEGDVTVVEFVDYGCPSCRAAQEAVERLLDEDSEVRLVVRPWPVGSPGSEAAARAALAARAQGVDAFRALHEAMLRLDAPPGEAPALLVAQVLGLDDALLARDVEAPAIADQIGATRRLAETLGLAAPPAFVVGDRLLQGAVTLDGLRDAVAAARDAGRP